MKVFVLINLLLIGSSTIAQDIAVDETFPIPRDKPLFIYHPSSDAMVFIAGSALLPDPARSDVWTLDETTWHKVEATGPGARAFFAGGLDKKTNIFYFFGGTPIESDGLRLEKSKGDVWTFDGVQWVKEVTNAKGIRHHHNMVYADHLNAFVLYGGFDENGADTTTWLMKDGQFTALRIPCPGVRYQFGMVYDANRQKVVLYGGGDHPDEHWEFDGIEWSQIVSEVNPGIKFRPAMAYDEVSRSVILHGGAVNLNSRDPRNYDIQDTWTWDGKEWKRIGKTSLFPIAMAYDPRRSSIIAYGFDGGDPTLSRGLCLWELRNNIWGKTEYYGEWNVLNYLEKRIALNEKDTVVIAIYANRLNSIGRYAEAEAFYKKLLHYYPRKTHLLLTLAEVTVIQNKYKEASVYYKEALAIAPTGEGYFNVARVYAKLKDKTSSFESLNKAIQYGYNSKKSFEGNPDLNSLKSDKRWNNLLKKLDPSN